MLTPEEIQSREFLVSLRGYDRDEVHAFLDEVAEAFAQLRARAAEPSAEADQADEDASAEAAVQRPTAEDVAPSPFAAIGAETQRILDAAHAAGEELRARAQEDAARARSELISAAEAEVAELRAQAAETRSEIDLLLLRRDEVSDRLRRARDTADLALMELDIDDPAPEAEGGGEEDVIADVAGAEEDAVTDDAAVHDAGADDVVDADAVVDDADASSAAPDGGEGAPPDDDAEQAVAKEEQGLVAATLFAGEPATTEAQDALTPSDGEPATEDQRK